MSPHNWIHLFLFFCHQHAALHGGLFKICSKLQPYLRTYQSKDVKDLKNYFHPQTLFGGLDLEGKIDVHTTQLEWIWQFSGFEVFFLSDAHVLWDFGLRTWAWQYFNSTLLDSRGQEIHKYWYLNIWTHHILTLIFTQVSLELKYYNITILQNIQIPKTKKILGSSRQIENWSYK